MTDGQLRRQGPVLQQLQHPVEADATVNTGAAVLALPHADLPPAGCWWDVAPAEVSESDTVRAARGRYEAGLATQRWHG